jgi:ABC-2 type transport system ATP-binding protein
VNQGEIFGFLGPNGAGKTTTIRILLDLLRADSGRASVFGLDCVNDSVAIRKRVGYLPGELGLYDHMVAQKVVDYFVHLKGGMDSKVVAELIDRLDIDLTRRVKQYSKGNRQKLGILLAFLNRPELVILDEPTSGLDPLLQKEFYDFTADQVKQGRTIFMSSHVLSEVDRVCTRAGIIREGKMETVAGIGALKEQMGEIFRVTIDGPYDPGDFELEGVTKVESDGENLLLHVTANHDGVLKRLAEYRVTKLTAEAYSLDDFFHE